MTLQDTLKHGQSTADNLVGTSDSRPLLKRSYENLKVIEGPTLIETTALNDSFVLDISVLGTGKLGDRRSSPVVSKVVNYNNKFIEKFRFDNHESTNTAYWDTTTYKLRMSADTDHSKAYNGMCLFKPLFQNEQTVFSAVLECTETFYGNDEIRYFMSADNGTNWEEAFNGTLLTFSDTGTTLLLRIVFLGNGANETYIENLTVEYTV